MSCEYNAMKMQNPTFQGWDFVLQKAFFATENTLFGAFLGYFYMILQKRKILCY